MLTRRVTTAHCSRLSSRRWSSDLLIDNRSRWSQPDGVGADLSVAWLEATKINGASDFMVG